MIIYAIDDRPAALTTLTNTLRLVRPGAELHSFHDGTETLMFAETSAPCDAAFIDVDLPDMNGIELAKELKFRFPRVNVIFTTGFPEYAGDAMDIHASGYLLKPVTAEKVRRELEDLRYPVPMETGMRVRFQCFGNFEAFLDNKPVVFQHEKTREILAYLVDRRAVCGNDEIIAALWQGKISGSYFRALRKDLVDTFQSRGCGDIFIQRWARIGIDGERVSCDYYDWQKGRPDAINAYRGEYMSQYDWAVLRVQPFEPR